jgi:FkbM family methyltransferase
VERRPGVQALHDTFHRHGANRSSGSAAGKLIRWMSWGCFLTVVVVTSPATKGHRVRCVARFWSWQVWRRLTGRPIQVLYPQGWRLEFPAWSDLAGVTAATGLHEPAEELFVFAFLRPGDEVVDVGANIGIYAVACAGLGTRVVAFEPSSRARDGLARNIELNGFEDAVRVVPAALGDEVGSTSFTTNFDVTNHVVAVEDRQPTDEIVDLWTLDAFVAEHPDWFARSAIEFVKIDAEGHDEAVLHGARRILVDQQPVVMVETWNGGDEIRAFLAQFGYRVYRYDYTRRTLVAYPPDWAGQANMIAVPDARLGEVRDRLASAPAPALAPPELRWRRTNG